ncbi:CalY family protein [Cytobacillus oceanisediminis]|uniref:LPXTG cell wall anchor domain-containing protein n=1 Tax=Cytobacillus TaxID=2675230 RepID=UPI00203C6C04|nr:MULTISPECIES: LPXTG cell wall anchor domain-containing protein [Cytobacillus]MBY0155871.1 LPXTG cell wall anchor domain-containing protein [Cytobacillus firmus]MCM3390888.1 CalY family protein [Cytobacillus oceanisediminis]MCM3531777.1 CalY family protein [Cytobacillus oceanisediminis]UQX52529.1 CalY family protein [Cytobacillus pseudoceanisediminis]
MKVKSLLAKPIKIFIIYSFVFLIVFGNKTAIALDKEIDINTNLDNSNRYLFKVENLKPGDWMPRNITIKNDGNQDFKYTSNIGKSKSIKGLFEELELEVKKDTKMLYEGKLKDFKGFSPRELGKGTEETLFFQVTMPEHLGNEFQNSAAEVEIIFLAEATGDSGTDNETPGSGDNNSGGGTNTSPPSTDATVIPEKVNKLPNTATNNYNLLLIGALFLSTGSVILLWRYRRLRSDT